MTFAEHWVDWDYQLQALSVWVHQTESSGKLSFLGEASVGLLFFHLVEVEVACSSLQPKLIGLAVHLLQLAG